MCPHEQFTMRGKIVSPATLIPSLDVSSSLIQHAKCFNAEVDENASLS